MSTASLLATLGTFLRRKDRKVKAGRAVDEINFRLSCRAAKDKMLNLMSRVIFVQDVNNSTVLKSSRPENQEKKEKLLV